MERILFVDDEPNVLQGLERSLRKVKTDWEMAFVPSAQEALAYIERTPVTAVVTDIRMPNVDGAQLLTEIKRRFPAVVRIALTAAEDRRDAIEAADLTHQFVVKPLDVDHLVGIVKARIMLNRLRS